MSIFRKQEWTLFTHPSSNPSATSAKYLFQVALSTLCRGKAKSELSSGDGLSNFVKGGRLSTLTMNNLQPGRLSNVV